MARKTVKKVEENLQTSTTNGLDLGETSVKEVGEVISKGVSEILGGVLDSNNELFDNLISAEQKAKEKEEIVVAGHKIEVVPRLNRLETFAALSIMIDIMEKEKNKSCYGSFIQTIDDMEFMFFASFFTNIGLHFSLEGYMKIKDLFDSEGVTDRFYEIIKESREEIRGLLKRVYDLWEKEYLAMAAYVPHMVSPVNELSEKISSVISSAEDTVLSSADIELKNMLIKYMLDNRNSSSGNNTRKANKKLQVFDKSMFQKKEIGDVSDLKILNGGEK